MRQIEVTATTRLFAELSKLPLLASFGFCTLLLFSTMHAYSEPLGSTFTYQGQLEEFGGPASGLFDFRMVVFDSLKFGSQVSPVVLFDDVEVLSGLVNIEVDFGSNVFNGERRWVQIEIRDGASTGSYTPLSPRQEIIPSPYTLHAKDSESVKGEEIETGTIGDCLSNGSGGSSGSVTFQAPFAVPPKVLMQVDESFNDTGCIATRLTARTETGFSWRAFGTSSSTPCDCYHWFAIGPR